MSKDYFRLCYKLACLDVLCAIDAESRYTAMRQMARIELSAFCLYGFDFLDNVLYAVKGEVFNEA